MPKKTKSQRLQILNEAKLSCLEHDLQDQIASKVLFRMLDNYYENGTTYINKELTLHLRYDMPRKYVVNLYNDMDKKDTVIIKISETTQNQK